jgi:hypothetical protein
MYVSSRFLKEKKFSRNSAFYSLFFVSLGDFFSFKNLIHYIRNAFHRTSSIWLDNFNKNLYASKPTLQSGTYAGNNWTGWAVHPVPERLRIDLACLVHEGEIVWAMPKDLEELFSYETEVYNACMAEQKTYGRDLYEDSLLLKHKARTVPLTPVVFDDDKDATLYQSRCQSTESLIPMTLSQENIGDNLGFHRQFKDFYDEHIRVTVNKSRYFAFQSDIKIFMPMMKV